jgi:hypothetical protein
MVASSAVGHKLPLFVDGEATDPECFMFSNKKLLMHCYHHQVNAWFDREVTVV